MTSDKKDHPIRNTAVIFGGAATLATTAIMCTDGGIPVQVGEGQRLRPDTEVRTKESLDREHITAALKDIIEAKTFALAFDYQLKERTKLLSKQLAEDNDNAIKRGEKNPNSERLGALLYTFYDHSRETRFSVREKDNGWIWAWARAGNSAKDILNALEKGDSPDMRDRQYFIETSKLMLDPAKPKPKAMELPFFGDFKDPQDEKRLRAPISTKLMGIAMATDRQGVTDEGAAKRFTAEYDEQFKAHHDKVIRAFEYLGRELPKLKTAPEPAPER